MHIIINNKFAKQVKPTYITSRIVKWYIHHAKKQLGSTPGVQQRHRIHHYTPRQRRGKGQCEHRVHRNLFQDTETEK